MRECRFLADSGVSVSLVDSNESVLAVNAGSTSSRQISKISADFVFISGLHRRDPGSGELESSFKSTLLVFRWRLLREFLRYPWCSSGFSCLALCSSVRVPSNCRREAGQPSAALLANVVGATLQQDLLAGNGVCRLRVSPVVLQTLASERTRL